MIRLIPATLIVASLLMVTSCSTRAPADPSPQGSTSRGSDPASSKMSEQKAPAKRPSPQDDEHRPGATDEAVEAEGDEVSKAAEGESAAALANVRPENASEKAPAEYDVLLDTTKGAIRIHVVRAWAPHGADRFFNLVKLGYFNDIAFFRVVEGFMAQVGMHGVPEVNARWQEAQIPDDDVSQSNKPGMVTFAARGQPNSRTTQFFINLGNNANLDSMRFAPFGRTRDMDVVRALHSGYGEGAPRGRGPSQGQIAAEGNAYLRREFPNLDYIKTATLVP